MHTCSAKHARTHAVSVRVFVFIPNEYERFLRGNYHDMAYSVLFKTASTPFILQPQRSAADLSHRGVISQETLVDREAEG